jgi:hypothetical protein
VRLREQLREAGQGIHQAIEARVGPLLRMPRRPGAVLQKPADTYRQGTTDDDPRGTTETPLMAIELDENILGIWYAQTGGDHGHDDFMMSLSRCPEGLAMLNRTRKSTSNDPWDDKDEKQWSRFVTRSADVEKAIDVCRTIVADVVLLAIKMNNLEPPGVVHELLRGGMSLDEYTKRLLELPFAHQKRVQ